MDSLHRLIIERIKANGCSGLWLLDVYQHLISRGASPDEAIKEMSRFVDEVIAKKAKPMERIE